MFRAKLYIKIEVGFYVAKYKVLYIQVLAIIGQKGRFPFLRFLVRMM